MGIDASILNSDDLQPRSDQFVCVRVINANALDLSLLSSTTICLSRPCLQRGPHGIWALRFVETSTGFAGRNGRVQSRTQSVAAIHRLSGSKQSLKGSRASCLQGACGDPALAGKYERELNWDGKVVQSVHCHQIVMPSERHIALKEAHTQRADLPDTGA
jgi:hypothetical protein